MKSEQDFTKVYNSYASKVHRLCLGYASGDHELAKEWLQETFIKVWTHRNSFHGKSSIATWIYRIAVNVCLSDLRSYKNNIPINDDLMLTQKSNDFEIEDEIKIQKMYQCIDQLNEQSKTLILMELEDIPQITIADTVGLAHGTLRTRLSRIRKSLLKCITNGK